MAKAICGEDASPALYEQAVIMAECEMVLLKLRAARVAIIRGDSIVGRKLERPNQESCFWADELMLAMEALAGGELRPAINLVKGQTRVLRDAPWSGMSGAPCLAASGPCGCSRQSLSLPLS